ncbi:MAG: glycosyltransferase family 2 protein [Blautia sp.]|nr:glycosyltransferase family 2 protein [Lachnoclostridium sp.]MCM1211030.1 glycosyltransferase family 2 protein [Blautia sp.]
MKKVDVIIPTYKPDKKFLQLIEKLEHQTVPIQKIIIMNTEQKYFDRLIYGTSFSEKYKNILVKHLSKREFDHGRTRNKAVGYSEAEVFIMMTQDAVPADEYMVEELLEGLKPEQAAVSYGRQLADDTVTEAERFTRNFNYPDAKMLKTRQDIPQMGVKTFFCSNVCAAYKRDIFDSLGGFIKHTIFNEDMIYAANAVNAGYAVAYQPGAKVYHAHNYGNREQFCRNFDLGVSQADHPEIFAGIASESEGIRLVRMTIAHLSAQKKKRQIPGVIINSGFKYMGYLAGKHYKKLPKRLVVKCSSNKEYWERDYLITAGSKIDPTKGYGRSEEEMNRRKSMKAL